VNMVMRDESVRKKKRRLDSFGNVTRSLEAGLRDRRSNKIDESIFDGGGVGLVLATAVLTRATAASRGQDGSRGCTSSE
jgi:hypothetical protein